MKNAIAIVTFLLGMLFIPPAQGGLFKVARYPLRHPKKTVRTLVYPLRHPIKTVR